MCIFYKWFSYYSHKLSSYASKSFEFASQNSYFLVFRLILFCENCHHKQKHGEIDKLHTFYTVVYVLCVEPLFFEHNPTMGKVFSLGWFVGIFIFICINYNTYTTKPSCLMDHNFLRAIRDEVECSVSQP